MGGGNNKPPPVAKIGAVKRGLPPTVLRNYSMAVRRRGQTVLDFGHAIGDVFQDPHRAFVTGGRIEDQVTDAFQARSFVRTLTDNTSAIGVGRQKISGRNQGGMPHGFIKRRSQRSRRMGGFKRRAASFTRGPRTRSGMSRRSNPTSLATSGMARPQISALGRQPFLKGAVFPPSYRTRLTTSNVFRVAVPVTTYPAFGPIMDARINSAFDPFILPAAGTQPLYFDQLKAIYHESVVVAAMIHVQIIEYANTKTLEFVTKVGLGTDTSIPSVIQATSSPTTSYFIMKDGNNQASDMRSLKRYVNMSRFFSKDVPEEGLFTERTAALSVGDNTCHWKLWTRHLDATDLASAVLSFRVNIVQWIKFSKRVQVAAS